MSKREHAISSRATCLDTQLLFGVMHQVASPHERARHGAANVDKVFANWLEAKHLVKRCSSVHLGRGNANKLTQVHHCLVRDISILFLRKMQ